MHQQMICKTLSLSPCSGELGISFDDNTQENRIVVKPCIKFETSVNILVLTFFSPKNYQSFISKVNA